MTWNTKSRKGKNTSFTELSTLAGCEQRWWYRFMEHADNDPSRAMMLGTLVHEGAAALYAGEKDWGRIGAVAQGMGLATDGSDETVDKAAWLLERYFAYYGADRSIVKVLGQELELKAKLPGTDVTVWGHLDEVWQVDGKVWVVERKTYGRRDRLDLLDIDPQITLYSWLARENGLDVFGTIFDGIYTYQWKGERALSESFDRLYLDRTETQIEHALEWARRILSRRTAVKRSKRPVRNIGPLCKSCSHREQCGEALSFSPVQIMTEEAVA